MTRSLGPLILALGTPLVVFGAPDFAERIGLHGDAIPVFVLMSFAAYITLVLVANVYVTEPASPERTFKMKVMAVTMPAFVGVFLGAQAAAPKLEARGIVLSSDAWGWIITIAFILIIALTIRRMP